MIFIDILIIMIILGFDISSTTIGWGVVETDGYSIKYIDSGYFKPLKDESDIFHKLNDSRTKIKEIINKFSPDEIAIENIVKFMEGKSSADSIITLTTYNRMVGLTCYDYLGKSPELYNVLSIRHGLKFDKKLPDKKEMPYVLEKHLNFKFPFEYKRATKKNQNPSPKEECFDRSDGLCVATHHAMVKVKANLPKQLKRKKK